MKKIFLFIAFSISFHLQAQDSSQSFVEPSLEELQMKFYAKDSSAVAVVLEEKGITHHDKLSDYDLRTDYYFRVKILKKDGYDKASIKLFHNKANRVTNIKGVTYNISESGEKTSTWLKDENIFKNDIVKGGSQEITFTLPDVKVGSILEYKYSITRWSIAINDWYFQSDIPKLKSTYIGIVNSDWKYKTRLTGFLKLDKDIPGYRARCINIKGRPSKGCSKYHYEMVDIPAFQNEKYTSSEKNFISRIIFDLTSRIYDRASRSSVQRVERNITKTWEGVDQLLKVRVFDEQINRSKFFKRHLPDEVLEIKDDVARARSVFKFIQNHYTWNDYYYDRGNMILRTSFEKKIGNAFEINLSLYNSLKAAGIESYPVMLSTRENGVLTDLYPTADYFNYLIVKAVINGEVYFLDAVSKHLAFGQVSFRCLNGRVRVMDFKNGSYWDGIRIKEISTVNTRLNLTLNTENEFVGEMTMLSKGYQALDKREEFETISKEKYLEEIESQNAYLEIGDYEVTHKNDAEKPLQEKFEVTFYDDSENQKYRRINPFFDRKFTENPFKLEERLYPVDFGVPSNYSYLFTLKIPEGYSVVSIPEESRVTLPNKGGVFMIKAQKKENEVNIYMRYALSKAVYTSEEYQELKEFFNQIIKAQQSYIVINPN